eukprot:4761808-Prymnesium_polylepis.1
MEHRAFLRVRHDFEFFVICEETWTSLPTCHLVLMQKGTNRGLPRVPPAPTAKPAADDDDEEQVDEKLEAILAKHPGAKLLRENDAMPTVMPNLPAIKNT